MAKIIPIKVEPVETRKIKVVEWMIGNTCNYNCSFCEEDIKSGTKRFFNIDDNKKLVDKIIKESVGYKIWFIITGGEPTLYPGLVELLKYIKGTGNYTFLTSNGSRTIRYWQELKEADCLDQLMISYHPEQTDDVEHIVNLCNLFTDTTTMQVVTITCLPEFFDFAVQAYDRIKKECSVMLNLSQINDNVGMSKYTPDQQRKLQSLTFSKSFNMKEKKANSIPVEDMYHNGMVRYTYPDGTTRSDFAVNFIKRGEDNFYGMSCHAGMDFVRIEWDSIRRAVCPVGERWTIFDENIFAQEPVKCTIHSCNCSIDLMTPKYASA